MRIKQIIGKIAAVIFIALAINTVLVCAFTTVGTVKKFLSAIPTTVFSDTYDTATPTGADSPTEADDRMREIKAAVQERMDIDHFWELTGTQVSDPCAGEHRKVLFTAPIAATPTVAANHGDLRIADVDGKAEFHWTDEDEQEVQMTQVGQVCLGHSTAPRAVIQNTTEEDGDGGRESWIIAKGEQSGAEVTTLGYIEFAHDGAADDEKGRISIVVNDGDDADAPSKVAMRWLSPGTIDVTNSIAVLDEDDLVTDSATQLATQQSIKAYADALTDPAYTGGESHTFNGGLIFKQGYKAVDDSSTTTISFAVSFTTGIVSVNATARELGISSNPAANDATITVISTSGFTILHDDGTIDGHYWQAWGY